MEGLKWAKKIVDDILIWAPTLEELGNRLRKVASRYRDLNVCLSKTKLQIAEELEFSRVVINSEGVKPNISQIESLSEFPTPKDTIRVRSFLGLANQLSGFVPDFAHMSRHLRGLRGKGASFIWLDEHQQEFTQMKRLLCSDLVVTSFNLNREVTLHTDASRLHGLGFAMGHMIDGRFKLVMCRSKALTPTQQRYSTNKLECLGVHYAINKCVFYLKGLPDFVLLTDHKRLEGIFKKDLFELSNPTMQRI